MENRVFILGSGFSKEINEQMPTLSELSNKILKNIVEHKDEALERQFFSEYIDKKLISEQILNNIEYLLSYLFCNFPWKDEETRLLHSSFYILISKVIRDLFLRIVLPESRNSKLEDFLKYLHKNELAVLTFNYDALLEEASRKILKQKNKSQNIILNGQSKKCAFFIENEMPETKYTKDKLIHVKLESDKTVFYFGKRGIEEIELNLALKDYGLNNDSNNIFKAYNDLQSETISLISLYKMPLLEDIKRLNMTFGFNLQKTFHLMKLHGSINWYYSGSKQFSGEQIYYSELDKQDNDPERELNKMDLVPLIIPPVLDKSPFYFNNTIKTMWDVGKNALKKAEEVFIIGYSMPLTDLSTIFLFQESIKENAIVYVVNKAENEQSLNGLIENYGEALKGKNLNFDFSTFGDNSAFDKMIKEKIKT